jgi:hypothetical protein
MTVNKQEWLKTSQLNLRDFISSSGITATSVKSIHAFRNSNLKLKEIWKIHSHGILGA